jgi:hypothetical protein
MLRAGALAVGVLAAAGVARAHGRFPATVSVTFREGDASTLVAGTTFGLVISRDGGARWSWICEEAIGYGDSYDPSVAMTAAGTLLVTSFDGLRVSRDGGCSWESAADVGATWAADVTLGPDGAIWTVTAGDGENRILASRDDAHSFTPVRAAPGEDRWYRTVRVAPADARRVYVTGYRLDEASDIVGSLLLDSDDGGASWDETELVAPDGTVHRLLAVARRDPELLFLRLDAPAGDTLLVARGGALEPAFMLPDELTAFVALSDGESYLAGSRFAGARLSRDGGRTWPELPGAPRLACAAQSAGGPIVACGVEAFALGTSTDGTAWSELLRLDEIEGPLACPETSPVTRVCGVLWPTVMAQIALVTRPDAGAADAATAADARPAATGGDGGCGCGAGMALLLIARRRW